MALKLFYKRPDRGVHISVTSDSHFVYKLFVKCSSGFPQIVIFIKSEQVSTSMSRTALNIMHLASQRSRLCAVYSAYTLNNSIHRASLSQPVRGMQLMGLIYLVVG